MCSPVEWAYESRLAELSLRRAGRKTQCLPRRWHRSQMSVRWVRSQRILSMKQFWHVLESSTGDACALVWSNGAALSDMATGGRCDRGAAEGGVVLALRVGKGVRTGALERSAMRRLVLGVDEHSYRDGPSWPPARSSSLVGRMGGLMGVAEVCTYAATFEKVGRSPRRPGFPVSQTAAQGGQS